MVFASQDPELVLVGNRSVLVKVNAVAATAGAAKPSGVLRIDDANGVLQRELPLTAPTGNLPLTSPATPSFSDSYSVVVPADLVRAGMRVTPRFTPAAANAVTVSPRVGGGVAITLTAVPVQIAGTVGQVVASPDAFIALRLPVSQVTRQSHVPLVSASVTALPTNETEWSTAFSRILNELDDLHLLENASARNYYYGFIPKRTFGLSGVGFRPGNAAVGFDLPSNATVVKETLLHEVGHNLSLLHAPCGSPSGPDPAYPYANATLGAGTRFIWGYDADARRFVDPRPTSLHDVMSYCDGDWFSDYNYRRVQVYLSPADRAQASAAATEVALSTQTEQDLLLLSGEIDASGQVSLNPPKASSGSPRAPSAGPYLLRLTTQQGAVIEYRFAGKEVDHLPQQRFAFTVPHPGPLAGIDVQRGGRVLTTRQPRERALALGGESATAQLVFIEQAGALRITWDAQRQPYLTVTHVGAARTVLAIEARGGLVVLPLAGVPAAGRFEFSLSDGLNSQLLRRER